VARDLFVGIGERRYKIERAWGTLPQGMTFSGLTKLAVDRRGHVYAFLRSNPPIVVFDGTGKFLRSWGGDTIPDGHGIFVTNDDRVLVVDRGGHRLLAYDINGKQLFSIGDPKNPKYQAPFNHPTDVATAPNGDMYVTDGYGNSCVHWFSADGQYKCSWGQRGHGPGDFMTPHGIWVLSDGRVLVSDRENHRVQIFDPQGNYLSEWGNFFRPMDVYADADGLVYISDQVPRLTVIAAQSGDVVGSCQPVPNIGHAVRGDPDGNLYCAEPRLPEVIRLTRLN
jgi:DNA-binding beta-propeller fold protein YncE